MQKPFTILAIETSCDDTAISIVTSTNADFAVRAHFVSSQYDIHKTWGGVVPNLAARSHAERIAPLVTEALTHASCTPNEIDLIAVTHGPGLIPALVVGVTAAQMLAYRWQKPLIGVHHIAGHIAASWLASPTPTFPALALVVSGGHTQLMMMHDHFAYEVIGQTIDDAVGEAYDKVGRMLGLPFPGGPEIAARADAFDAQHAHYNITLPHPLRDGDHYDFSFSGLKTAVRYAITDFRKEHALAEDTPLPEDFVVEFAWIFQQKVTEILLHKTAKALQQYAPESLILAGGVSANKHLRHALAGLADTADVSFHVPDFTYCLDNATMIAAAAAFQWKYMSDAERATAQTGYSTVSAKARRAL